MGAGWVLAQGAGPGGWLRLGGWSGLALASRLVPADREVVLDVVLDGGLGVGLIGWPRGLAKGWLGGLGARLGGLEGFGEIFLLWILLGFWLAWSWLGHAGWLLLLGFDLGFCPFDC